jgi:hypothetical protein
MRGQQPTYLEQTLNHANGLIYKLKKEDYDLQSALNDQPIKVQSLLNKTKQQKALIEIVNTSLNTANKQELEL